MAASVELTTTEVARELEPIDRSGDVTYSPDMVFTADELGMALERVPNDAEAQMIWAMFFGGARCKHGQSGSPAYKAWASMIDRCFNPKNASYCDYGGRGIGVASHWKADFINFYRDMGVMPGPGYSLERIDVNGHYVPDNCKWIHNSEQAKNKRNNFRIEFNGRTMIAADWSRETGITSDTIIRRIRDGWSAERALTTPIGKNSWRAR